MRSLYNKAEKMFPKIRVKKWGVYILYIGVLPAPHNLRYVLLALSLMEKFVFS